MAVDGVSNNGTLETVNPTTAQQLVDTGQPPMAKKQT